jgi:hypothetical protein
MIAEESISVLIVVVVVVDLKSHGRNAATSFFLEKRAIHLGFVDRLPRRQVFFAPVRSTFQERTRTDSIRRKSPKRSERQFLASRSSRR